MTQERIQRLRDALVKLAIDWEAHPHGVQFDSGHCDSEIAAVRLDQFLQATQGEQDIAVMFDKLHALYDRPGTDFGSWRAREDARRLANDREVFGRDEVAGVLQRAGFAEDMADADARAVQATHAFEARAPRAGLPAAALRFDLEAFLQDPKQTAKLSAVVVEACQKTLDAAGPDVSFRTLARQMNATRHKLEDQGYRGQLGGLRQVLANFGDPDGMLFGIVPASDSLSVQRRYRLPGR